MDGPGGWRRETRGWGDMIRSQFPSLFSNLEIGWKGTTSSGGGTSENSRIAAQPCIRTDRATPAAQK